MSIFMLDTDAVSSCMSSIESLSSKFDNLASQVEGFDVTCEDGFDFAGAKGVIANNINACAVKVSNTAKVLENVVNSHTSLQSKLKFQGGEEEQNTSNQSSSSSSNKRNQSSSSSNSGNYYNSSSGTYIAASAPAGVAASTTVSDTPFKDSLDTSIKDVVTNPPSVVGGYGEDTPVEVVKIDNEKWKEVQAATTKYLTDADSMVIAQRYGLPALPEGSEETNDGLSIPGCAFKLEGIKVFDNEVVGLPAKGAASVILAAGATKPELWNFGYGEKSEELEMYEGISQISSQKVSEMVLGDSLLNSIEFDETGYATIDGRYVISCDSYFGEVGDKVQVFTADGPIECVIGYVPEEATGELKFLTNDDFNLLDLKDKVTMSNIKSINNLEYAEGGSKYDSSIQGVDNTNADSNITGNEVNVDTNVEINSNVETSNMTTSVDSSTTGVETTNTILNNGENNNVSSISSNMNSNDISTSTNLDVNTISSNTISNNTDIVTTDNTVSSTNTTNTGSFINNNVTISSGSLTNTDNGLDEEETDDTSDVGDISND